MIGWLMGPVAGYYLAHPYEPTVYITGDTVLTDMVETAIERLRPQVIVAPAGTANFGIGKDLMFSEAELIELAKLAQSEREQDEQPPKQAGLVPQRWHHRAVPLASNRISVVGLFFATSMIFIMNRRYTISARPPEVKQSFWIGNQNRPIDEVLV
ncbi:MBL fold metallo-hydrolase [Thalassoroseus pseudoceratinae]|uniref:hypothetical protein n=1 Tax=Thalassoroseus pseudoceratinae TaxID=2713176 RepID=UPI00141F318C|nr:hypothetical protein [Thalassoroseus pseudoceratinae]